jgi:hypothetical protein
MEIRLLHFSPAGAFDWRWPSRNVEYFERSWTGRIAIDGAEFEFRHAIGHREVYGRERVHSVTWLGAPMVGLRPAPFSAAWFATTKNTRGNPLTFRHTTTTLSS